MLGHAKCLQLIIRVEGGSKKKAKTRLRNTWMFPNMNYINVKVLPTFFYIQKCLLTVVVVFPQAPFRVTNVPRQASAGIIQLRNCTMAFLRMAVGDLVTPFVLESCLIIHVLLNLQVHTWGMSLASSGKFV